MANMPCTITQTGRRWHVDEHNIYDSLNWLIAANRDEAYRRSFFRNADDEEQALLMRRPIPTMRAYELFGLLLGALPPAAIFLRLLYYFAPRTTHEVTDLIFFCLVMNVICVLAGRIAGAKIGRRIDEIERASWLKMILLAGFNGLRWAIVTGAAGGAVVLGVGAFFGALLAIPVGVLAFILFTLLHRLVARGGMIDARHFWPLACGVAAFIAALILGR
jgi:hypothetical protein